MATVSGSDGVNDKLEAVSGDDDVMWGGTGNDKFIFGFGEDGGTGGGGVPLSFAAFVESSSSFNFVLADDEANLSQSQLNNAFEAWIKYLIEGDGTFVGLAERYGIEPDAKVEVDWGSQTLPKIEGLSEEVIAEIFGGFSQVLVEVGTNERIRYYPELGSIWGAAESDLVLDYEYQQGKDGDKDKIVLWATEGIEDPDGQQAFIDSFTVQNTSDGAVISRTDGSWQVLLENYTYDEEKEHEFWSEQVIFVFTTELPEL
jgi:hypothetical protein